MLALEGKLKKKSERLIAIDLFGKESVEGKWHDSAPERGVVRRRVDQSNGGGSPKPIMLRTCVRGRG